MKDYSLNCLGLCLLVVIYGYPAAVAATEPPTILVMGDSLSAAYGIATNEGWVGLLARRLRDHGHGYRVVNASVSGETTSGGLTRLPRALEEHEPEIVIIELGANDGLRGIEPRSVRQNLGRMIRLSQRQGADVLLAGVRLPPNYGQTFSQRHYAVYAALAEQTGTSLVPFLLKDVVQDRALMQEDGLHPTAAAQPLILDTVWPKLEALLGSSLIEQ